MFRQILEVAKIVVISSFRRKLIIASLLIIFPLLLAAWLFEVSNPGFQSGFILDVGSGIMSLLSAIIILVLSFENLFWPVEQSTPWFYFSRLRSRLVFLLGKFIGIIFVLGFVLFLFASLFASLIFFTSGSFLFLPFTIAFTIWNEFSIYLSVFFFFSTFLSKLMTVGMMLPFVFISYSVNYIKVSFNNIFSQLLLIVFPDVAIFNSYMESNQLLYLVLILGYSIFMSLFYLFLAGFIIRQKDL